MRKSMNSSPLTKVVCGATSNYDQGSALFKGLTHHRALTQIDKQSEELAL